MEGTWVAKKRLVNQEVSEADNSNTALIHGHKNKYEKVNNSSVPDINDNPNDATSVNKFSIDYSKRGTAKCRKCKKVISKGIVRIGKNVPFKAGHIIQYYHVNCAFESFLKAKLETNVITSINEIDGIESVPIDVKLQIATLINDTNMESDVHERRSNDTI